jgi:hypothetical protein
MHRILQFNVFLVTCIEQKSLVDWRYCNTMAADIAINILLAGDIAIQCVGGGRIAINILMAEDIATQYIACRKYCNKHIDWLL